MRTGVVVKGVPQNVPHCLLSPIANVNVSLGMAVLLRERGGGAAAKSVAVEAGSAGEEAFASHAAFKVAADTECKHHLTPFQPPSRACYTCAV